MPENSGYSNLLALTAEIVSAHVANNNVAPDSLPALITSVFRALTNVGTAPAQAEKPEPAVPLKKSVFPDHIICLEDGKKLKMLKRHLKTAYNMTPDQYREKWDLPASYPMTAPNYAKTRSALAKKIGLGRTREPAGNAPEVQPDATPKAPAAAPKATRTKRAAPKRAATKKAT
ncbi:MucR family transcriptional regulator [Limobrevibacterium gyesilva]|uniref:MucR family transcriptional regulator n=1 Tax=Limobrevibacterium gyesilva TaxID=2991712 RepID=UPI003242C15E